MKQTQNTLFFFFVLFASIAAHEWVSTQAQEPTARVKTRPICGDRTGVPCRTPTPTPSWANERPRIVGTPTPRVTPVPRTPALAATTQQGPQNAKIRVGSLNLATQVIHLDTSIQYGQLAAFWLQGQARIVLNNNLLVVTTERPDPEKLNFITVGFSAEDRITDTRLNNSWIIEVLRRQTEAIGNEVSYGVGNNTPRWIRLDEAIRLGTDAIIDQLGLSGRDFTEYFYQGFRLQMGDYPLPYLGYAYFKVVGKVDRYGAITIRHLYSIGDEEYCWQEVNPMEMFPNFDGKRELLAFKVAVRQSSFITWLKGGQPQFDPPKAQELQDLYADVKQKEKQKVCPTK